MQEHYYVVGSRIWVADKQEQWVLIDTLERHGLVDILEQILVDNLERQLDERLKQQLVNRLA